VERGVRSGRNLTGNLLELEDDELWSRGKKTAALRALSVPTVAAEAFTPVTRR